MSVRSSQPRGDGDRLAASARAAASETRFYNFLFEIMIMITRHFKPAMYVM